MNDIKMKCSIVIVSLFYSHTSYDIRIEYVCKWTNRETTKIVSHLEKECTTFNKQLCTSKFEFWEEMRFDIKTYPVRNKSQNYQTEW